MPFPKPLIPPPWKVEIVASDISYASLRIGQEGLYTEQQMEPVDYTCRLRYFEKSGDKYAVKAQLKQLVQFDFHNLKTEFLPRRNDIILDRKSTRLNSSHVAISYAVFCLKKKNIVRRNKSVLIA